MAHSTRSFLFRMRCRNGGSFACASFAMGCRSLSDSPFGRWVGRILESLEANPHSNCT